MVVNILFVEKKLRADKLGMCYLSSILKKAGHNVDMIQDDVDNAEEYLDSHQVDFVMYSVTTGEHQWYIQRNKELKRQFDFTTVVGGPHFTFFPEQGEQDPAVDFVVRGPAEDVVLDIIDGKIRNKITMGHLPDINTLPFPDRSILYKYDEFGKARVKRFITGRDCVHHCSFCYNHLYQQIYRDERSMFYQRIAPGRIIEEIQQVKNTYGLELVNFSDDDITRNKRWITKFCKKFKKLDMSFSGSIRADSVDYPVLEQMAKAGCVFLFIGLQSANKDTLRLLRRTVMPEQVEQVCKWCSKLDIKVRVENMIGLPVKDPLQDALDTLKFNMKLGIDDSWSSIFQPFPKTELWKYCINQGFINADTDIVRFYDSTVLRIPDAEKINRLHKWWYFIVKHNLPKRLVDVLLELPIDEEISERMWNLRWRLAAEELYGL